MRHRFTYMMKLMMLFVAATFTLSFHNGNTVQDFSLKNVDGNMVSLADYHDAKGFIVVFTCNHCPFAKLYTSRLKDLSDQYRSKGVYLIAISSTDPVIYEDDSFEKMVEKSQDEKFNFPYLYDERQEVARQFKAQKTPHAFVIWKDVHGWSVRYNGAIDDNGAEPSQVKHHYVREAVNALLLNKEVQVKETKSIGCQINFTASRITTQ